ncbi:MAG: VWA domain-containing protein [Planctomycetota bacterium]|nr:VWA domain-containing protein [Planctomycetota bacterium]
MNNCDRSEENTTEHFSAPASAKATGLLWCSLLLLPLILSPPLWEQVVAGEETVRRPLDMPSGGGGNDDDEEDAPETIIFYGQDYEGDAFFWCLDKSGSMDWGGAMEDLKQEMAGSVMSLSPAAEFSLVAFSTNMAIWSPAPRPARLPEKAAALSWVNALQPEGWTCLAPAAVQTIQICNQSSKPHRQVIILSDGAPYCDGIDTSTAALAEITMANWQMVPIHTIFIGSETEGIDFMQTLASMNQGSFHICQN